ncbi:hypothetical protein ACJX0J_011737, partial [Zea mays]
KEIDIAKMIALEKDKILLSLKKKSKVAGLEKKLNEVTENFNLDFSSHLASEEAIKYIGFISNKSLYFGTMHKNIYIIFFVSHDSHSPCCSKVAASFHNSLKITAITQYVSKYIFPQKLKIVIGYFAEL